jgi:hypothetical protein
MEVGAVPYWTVSVYLKDADGKDVGSNYGVDQGFPNPVPYFMFIMADVGTVAMADLTDSGQSFTHEDTTPWAASIASWLAAADWNTILATQLSSDAVATPVTYSGYSIVSVYSTNTSVASDIPS